MRFAAILFGAIAVVSVPAGIAAAIYLSSVNILPALEVSIPIAFVCGLIGISLARRARYRVDRSVSRRGARTVRFARFLVWAGMYVAVVSGLALGFYGLLVARS